ncbi:hypothetical protein FL966_06590 [Caproiciproducens galactitolivorans]|uniref:Uncharacterized protein n=1 Tax=Caproiciproducens galactitolivorans TaxID=642589 RepID=A0A4Z0Y8X1_9FIRM|nr:hypothetical protein [Caproiciproducens galactitolivorans]QEY34748.1 hypothetical protein FL966_06590 [Caproiciproducens galactitolivorans]TGJ76005.1 hypothetical protein CAGA_19810 [Caproiciproducens galactitolivorans]
MKKLVSVILLVLVVAFSSLPAYAAEKKADGQSGVVRPSFVNIMSLSAGLSINAAGKATCTGSVDLYDNSYTVKMTVTLQKYNGNGWSGVKSWSKNGKGNAGAQLSESYYVTSGKYRVCTTARVYNTAGKLVETESAYSAERTY